VAELQGKVDLVDVRPPDSYSGADAPADAIGGHIPGARNRPCGSMLTEDGRMKPPEELLPLIRGEGERAQLPLVISCQSGVTACFGALAARVTGLPDPLIYPGSFSDWVAREMPVVEGTEPDGILATA
jgi:thiosulfate/3-mercaptopyruvate sulfurtransferase